MKKIILTIMLTIFSLPTLAEKNNCSAFAGNYIEGGHWETRYTVKADCSGSYCVKVLNLANHPENGYGWHCDRNQGVKKIKHWAKTSEQFIITFSNGQIIRRNIVDLVKD